MTKYLKSWKKHSCIFFSNCSKSSENVWILGKDDCEIGDYWPTPLTRPSAPRVWMKDNWLKFESTSSHILLVNVSESGPISEFSTFLWSDFLTNFTGVIFFHDSNHFLTLYPLWRRKRISFEIFFLRIWVQDQQFLKKIKIGKLFFHRFQNIAHLFGSKT